MRVTELVSTFLLSLALTRGARISKHRRGDAVEEPREFVEIVPQSREELDVFLSMPEFDREDAESLSPDLILVYTTKDQRAALEKAGLKYAPAMEPAVDVVAASAYAYAPGVQNWGAYCGYDCMTSRLQDLSASCGYSLESIGQSIDGREIWVMVIGPGAPKVLMAGNIHGDETVGGQLLQRWMWETCFEPSAEQAAVAQYAVAYMPMMNPDGYWRGRRGNADGYDLNRDFPEPGENPSSGYRQPETLAYMNYVSSTPSLEVSLMYHGGAVVANYPYDSCYTNISPQPCGGNGRPPAPTPDDAWAKQLSRAYSWPASTRCLYGDCIINGAYWYQIRGSSQDYDYYHKGIMAITLEVSSTKNPSASTLPGFYTENYQGIYNFIETANRGQGPTPAPVPTPAPAPTPAPVPDPCPSWCSPGFYCFFGACGVCSFC